MSDPILPGGNKPILPVGSEADPIPVSIKGGQSVLDSKGDTIKVIAERLRIEVERVPIGRRVESAPPVREENGVTIIPIMEEVVVTETRLMLKEERHIRRVAETHEHQQTVLLRRQRAEVERLPATGKPITDVPPATSIKEDQR